jgi:hypothetical protein
MEHAIRLADGHDSRIGSDLHHADRRASATVPAWLRDPAQPSVASDTTGRAGSPQWLVSDLAR